MHTIVIIDDDRAVLSLYLKLLRNCDRFVHTFSNPVDGLHFCLNNPIDLIITDYMMEPIDGAEVLLELKRHHVRSKIIVLTGGGSLIDASFCMKVATAYGVDQAMNKPVDSNVLKQTVSMLLE